MGANVRSGKGQATRQNPRTVWVKGCARCSGLPARRRAYPAANVVCVRCNQPVLGVEGVLALLRDLAALARRAPAAHV